MSDSHRFSELQQGLPGIPRSLLAQRLKMLAREGVVERREDGKRVEYHLTLAGQELMAVIQDLGEWGQRWVNHTIPASDVDPNLPMWDMHRRVYVDLLPVQRVMAQFDFRGARRNSYWLVLEKPEPSVCLQDLGFDIDLLITTDTVALHRVWMGRMGLSDAIREGWITLEGPPERVKAFPSWLALNHFAGVAPASRPPS